MTTTLDHEEMTFRQRVIAGGLLLTVVQGEAWWNEIDLDQLDLWHPFDCILGQLYGGFEDGMGKLGLIYGDTFAFGFNLKFPIGYDATLAAMEYDALTDEWKELIRTLRSDVTEP